MDWPLLQSSFKDEGTAWLIYGMVGLSLAYIVLRPMLKRRRDPLEKSVPNMSLSRQRSVERQMESLLVELSEMARQITAQIDTRTAKLEALLKEADEKLAALRGSEHRANPDAHGIEEPPDPRHAEIYALADQGRGPKEIATQLNRPNGEVELILALRRQET